MFLTCGSKLTSHVQVGALVVVQGSQAEADEHNCCAKQSSGNNAGHAKQEAMIQMFEQFYIFMRMISPDYLT